MDYNGVHFKCVYYNAYNNVAKHNSMTFYPKDSKEKRSDMNENFRRNVDKGVEGAT